jgi:hypothetical protein
MAAAPLPDSPSVIRTRVSRVLREATTENVRRQPAGSCSCARSELFVGAGTCEEVDKIRGRSARSRTVPGRTRTRAWPRRTGREPVERFALRRVSRDFKAPAPAHRTRLPPDKRRPGTLGGGTTRRDHGARGRHNPSRPRRARAAQSVATTARAGHTSRSPTPGRQQSLDAWSGRRFLRKQRAGGSLGASICAGPVVRYRDCRLCCTQNSRGTRKERGRDEHRATLF